MHHCLLRAYSFRSDLEYQWDAIYLQFAFNKYDFVDHHNGAYLYNAMVYSGVCYVETPKYYLGVFSQQTNR